MTALHEFAASGPACASAACPAILELGAISLSFGGVKALNNVHLSVANGEVCAIIGPNGAGKSSLLNVINGVYQPDAGCIVYAGQARDRFRPHEAAVCRIARTFQNIALFRGMSVIDNVMTGLNLRIRATFLEQSFRIGRTPREERQARRKAEEVIDFLHLQAIRHAPVGDLPYGLQKRVELARALVSEPRLLLLDEPMAGMNQDEKRDMCRFILDASTELGTTVVLIEHDVGVVMDISDHVIVLDYGRKIADGAPADVCRSQQVIDAYLGVRN